MDSFFSTWYGLWSCLDENLLIKYYMINHSILLKIQNMMDISTDLLQWWCNYTCTVRDLNSRDKSANENKIISNQHLAEDSYRPIVRKFEKREVKPSFKYNIWSAALVDMQLKSNFTKGPRFLLCVINIYSKYAWNVPLKNKKGITITNAL